MSVQAMSAVLNSRRADLQPLTKLVLLALANRYDESRPGSCYPTQLLIARECNVTDRAVREHIKWLDDKGLISRETQRLGPNKGTITHYTLHLEALKLVPEQSSGSISAGTGASLVPEPRRRSAGTPAPMKSNRQEPSVEPIEPKGSIIPDPKIPKPPVKTALPEDWTLPTEWSSDARTVAFKAKQPITDQDIENEADSFRDHGHSKSIRHANWRAAWRNWIRNYLKWRKPGNAPNRAGPFATSQYGGSSIADAAIRRHRERQNGNGVSYDGRGHDIPAESNVVDGQFRLIK